MSQTEDSVDVLEVDMEVPHSNAVSATSFALQKGPAETASSIVETPNDATIVSGTHGSQVEPKSQSSETQQRDIGCDSAASEEEEVLLVESVSNHVVSKVQTDALNRSVPIISSQRVESPAQELAESTSPAPSPVEDTSSGTTSSGDVSKLEDQKMQTKLTVLCDKPKSFETSDSPRHAPPVEMICDTMSIDTPIFQKTTGDSMSIEISHLVDSTNPSINVTSPARAQSPALHGSDVDVGAVCLSACDQLLDAMAQQTLAHSQMERELHRAALDRQAATVLRDENARLCRALKEAADSRTGTLKAQLKLSQQERLLHELTRDNHRLEQSISTAQEAHATALTQAATRSQEAQAALRAQVNSQLEAIRKEHTVQLQQLKRKHDEQLLALNEGGAGGAFIGSITEDQLRQQLEDAHAELTSVKTTLDQAQASHSEAVLMLKEKLAAAKDEAQAHRDHSQQRSVPNVQLQTGSGNHTKEPKKATHTTAEVLQAQAQARAALTTVTGSATAAKNAVRTTGGFKRLRLAFPNAKP